MNNFGKLILLSAVGMTLSCNKDIYFSGNEKKSIDLSPSQLVFEKKFNNTRLFEVTERFSLGQKIEERRLSLKNEINSHNISRVLFNKKQEFFENSGAVKKETEQSTVTSLPLDIVLVIDDSGSMAKEHDKLSAKFNSLVEKLGDTHWKIAITTTTVPEPEDEQICLIDVIDKFDPNPNEEFIRIVNSIDTDGSPNERGYRRAIDAINCNYAGDSWTRESSMLGVIFVSDEDDCTEAEFKCISSDPDLEELNVKAFQKKLKELENRHYSRKVYGLISIPGNKKGETEESIACSLQNPNADDINDTSSQGKSYFKVIKKTDGLMGCIWEEDYESIFQKISEDLIKNIKSEYSLNFPPLDNDIQVIIDDEDVTGKVKVIDNRVVFKEAPQVGAKMKISYKYLVPGSLTNEYLLNQIPIELSLKVMLDRKVISNSDFEWVEDKNSIVLNSIPPKGTKVDIEYDGMIESINIVLENLSDLDSLEIKQEEYMENDYFYNKENKTLSIPTKNFPKKYLPVSISYEKITGIINSYKIEGISTDSTFIGAFYGQGFFEKIEGAKYINSELYFENDSFLDGEEIEVRFQKSLPVENSFSLENNPLFESISIKAPNHCSNNDIWIEENNLVSKCQLNPLDQIEVSYKIHKGGLMSSFELKEVENPDDCQWKVFATESSRELLFSRKNRTVFILEELPPGTEVLVRAELSPGN